MTRRQPKGVPVGGQFAEGAHDEASAGLDDEYGFWEGPNDPAVIGADPSRYRFVYPYSGTDDMKVSHPTRAAGAKSLASTTPTKGDVSVIAIDAVNSGSYLVAGPSDGTPKVVLTQGGGNELDITSGNIIVSAKDDISGTDIRVREGARAVVIAGDRCLTNVHADAGSHVTVVACPGARGVVSGDGAVSVVHPDQVTHNLDVQTSGGFLPEDGSTPF